MLISRVRLKLTKVFLETRRLQLSRSKLFVHERTTGEMPTYRLTANKFKTIQDSRRRAHGGVADTLALDLRTCPV